MAQEEEQHTVVNLELTRTMETRDNNPQHSATVEIKNRGKDQREEWMSISRGKLIMVITLITTLSFQLGVTPPGGFWQDSQDGHKAGAPVMKDSQPIRFLCFKASCWLCFYSSVVLVFVLLIGTSIKSRVFKTIFVFNLSCLVFLYQISQTDTDHITWAFITSSVSFCCGIFYILLE